MHEIGSAKSIDAYVQEAGSPNSDEARMREIGGWFGAQAHKELFQSNDGETMNSVWQDVANCRTAETAADYQQSSNSVAYKTLGCLRYTEKPGTPHFEPTIESPVSLDLIISSASLVMDVRKLESARKAEATTFLPPWKDTLEFKRSLFVMQGEAFHHIKQAISKNSPQDVATMLTLANDSLDGSGSKFVYNHEGYVDLQTQDGRIHVLTKPKR